MASPAAYYGVVGKAINLQCTMKAASDQPVFWFLGNTNKVNSNANNFANNLITSTYTIAVLDSSHEGAWACSLSDDAGYPGAHESVSATSTLTALSKYSHDHTWNVGILLRPWQGPKTQPNPKKTQKVRIIENNQK